MDGGGGGEEGKQQPHLVLAHKLFLLSQPDVDDLAKVALREDVLAAVKSDGTKASPPPICFLNCDLVA
jgi:26S proteasome regulatory subunit N7